MKSLHFSLFLILISLTTASTTALIYAQQGCRDMCADVRIPYPFGIGANCSLNKWYAVDCNSSTPYLSALKNLEVLGLSLENQTVTVNVSMISDCQNPVWNSSNIDLDGSPFLFSKSHNKFIVEGCGTATISGHGKVLTGCSTICTSEPASVERSNCYGINCCQANIPYFLKNYSVNTTSLAKQGRAGACGAAFLVDENFYAQGRFSGQSVVGNNSFVPTTLRWSLTDRDFSMLNCEWSFRNLQRDLGNGTSLESVICRCRPTQEGNPYLFCSCQDTEECRRCEDSGNYFSFDVIYDGDGLDIGYNLTCIQQRSYSEFVRKSSSSLGVILGVSISVGILLLTAGSFGLYKIVKRAKDKRRKKRFFKRNGGLLLKQQHVADTGLVDKTILFTSKELEKATDHFHENRILGR